MSAVPPLCILGLSGFAREVAAYAVVLAPEREVFFVDHYDKSGTSATVVHPSAVVMGQIAPSCVIASDAVIALNARLENHVVVNYNATVGHDTLIESLCVIGPGVAVGGWCRLTEATYIGAGA
jgi:UDP-3-O-[3-hydroxymyristoyl] glucosamine N-acyltransferase